jgi:hypothetical protein
MGQILETISASITVVAVMGWDYVSVEPQAATEPTVHPPDGTSVNVQHQ